MGARVLPDGGMVSVLEAPAFLPAPPAWVFLLMHMGTCFLIARVLPYKAYTVPAVFCAFMMDCLTEHWSHHPSIAAIGSLFQVPKAVVGVFLLAFYVVSFRKGQTGYAVASLVSLVAWVILMTHLHGPAAESVEASNANCENDDWLRWHFVGDWLFWGVMIVGSCTISSEADGTAKKL